MDIFLRNRIWDLFHRRSFDARFKKIVVELNKLLNDNSSFAAQVSQLAGEGKALRYLARIELGQDGRAEMRVGPEGVDPSHPAARLVGVEAFVAFTTARHSERPLVVQGTGVGGANTAGGVLAEIFRISFGHGAR